MLRDSRPAGQAPSHSQQQLRQGLWRPLGAQCRWQGSQPRARSLENHDLQPLAAVAPLRLLRLHWRRCSLSTRGVTAPRCFWLLAPSLCWSNRLAAGLIPACRRSVCRGRGALPPAVGVVFVTEDKQEQLIVNRVGAGQAVLPLGGLGVNSTKHSMGLAAHEKEQQQVKEQVT